jgi:hypothetical protein
MVHRVDRAAVDRGRLGAGRLEERFIARYLAPCEGAKAYDRLGPYECDLCFKMSAAVGDLVAGWIPVAAPLVARIASYEVRYENAPQAALSDHPAK